MYCLSFDQSHTENVQVGKQFVVLSPLSPRACSCGNCSQVMGPKNVIYFNDRMWSRLTLYVKCLETTLLGFDAVETKLTTLLTDPLEEKTRK